ncbi:MAG: ABC transporter permease subunit [Roseiflexaceae bacterium]
MHKVGILLAKEWLELRKQRWMLISLALLPLFFTLMPIGIMYAISQSPTQPPDPQTAELIRINSFLQGMNDREVGQALIGQQFSLFILIIPLMVPSVIAAYSIVGEKNNRTLEPLLATPIHVWELLLAKCLAAVAPALLLTLIAGIILSIGIRLTAVSASVVRAILNPGWMVLLILCSPIAAIITVMIIIAISSRVNDPRSAQQISGLLVLPLVGLVFGQLFGGVAINPALGLLIVLILGVMAIIMTLIAIWIFQREQILTRWSSK